VMKFAVVMYFTVTTPWVIDLCQSGNYDSIKFIQLVCHKYHANLVVTMRLLVMLHDSGF